MKSHVDSIVEMAHSPIRNYVIPGLTSSLIGNRGPNGLVRLFECSRNHYEPINPHSHRFNFNCLVLRGEVKNILWKQFPGLNDKYQATKVYYTGKFGKYRTEVIGVESYTKEERIYMPGQWYSMEHNEIHSIYFSEGCKVLFFESKPILPYSIVLEPVVNGVVVPTFKVEKWMFQKE